MRSISVRPNPARQLGGLVSCEPSKYLPRKTQCRHSRSQGPSLANGSLRPLPRQTLSVIKTLLHSPPRNARPAPRATRHRPEILHPIKPPAPAPSMRSPRPAPPTASLYLPVNAHAIPFRARLVVGNCHHEFTVDDL